MSAWKTVSSKKLHSTPWITLRQDEVLNHNGKQLTYTFLEVNSPSVYIVALNDENKVLIQQQYRYTVDHDMWTLPAGHSDDDEPLTAAKRELLEETGLVSDDWTDLGETFGLVGVAKGRGFIFLARNVRRKSDERDADELIGQQSFKSFDEIEAMIFNNEITSTNTLSGLYMAKLHLKAASDD